MKNYERFKKALQEYEERRYTELKEEVKRVKAFVEKMLTVCFESTASQARSNYSGLDMY